VCTSRATHVHLVAYQLLLLSLLLLSGMVVPNAHVVHVVMFLRWSLLVVEIPRA
jgi:hypothetical protein